MMEITSEHRSELLTRATDHMNALAAREVNGWLLPGYVHMEGAVTQLATLAVPSGAEWLVELTDDQTHMFVSMISTALNRADDGLLTMGDERYVMLGQLLGRISDGVRVGRL